MSCYKLPDSEKVIPEPSPQIIAASAFVAEVDEGGAMSEGDRLILREALSAIICGAKPQMVFQNQPKRTRPKVSGRDLVVAVYIESRLRFYKQNGLPPAGQGQGRTPLQRAKDDALGAFNWSKQKPSVKDPESAIQDAWTRWRKNVGLYSTQVIEFTLKPWEDGWK